MPFASRLQRVRHRPDDILNLVANVEDYPKFIALISALRVTRKTQLSESHERFEAEAIVAFKFMSETFRSVVDVERAARTITVAKADKGGAVKSLSNTWAFHELSDGSTLVEFDVDVRLKAFPLEMLARDKFTKVADKIMAMFIGHAGEVLEIVGGDTLDVPAEMKRLELGKPLTA